jgi:hypothetical protein
MIFVSVGAEKAGQMAVELSPLQVPPWEGEEVHKN